MKKMLILDNRELNLSTFQNCESMDANDIERKSFIRITVLRNISNRGYLRKWAARRKECQRLCSNPHQTIVSLNHRRE